MTLPASYRFTECYGPQRRVHAPGAARQPQGRLASLAERVSANMKRLQAARENILHNKSMN